MPVGLGPPDWCWYILIPFVVIWTIIIFPFYLCYHCISYCCNKNNRNPNEPEIL